MRLGLSLLLLFGLALAGCTPTPKEPTPIWSYDPQTYFDGSAFAASLFSRSTVLVTKPNSWNENRDRMAVLDPVTGAVRWERDRGEWVLHPRGSLAPLVMIGAPYKEGVTAPEMLGFLTEIDPATGKDRRRVPLEKPIQSFEAFFVHAGDRILYLGRPTLQAPPVLGALDPATGKSLWQVPSVSGAHYLRPPVLLRDRVIFAVPTPAAYSLADGRELFRLPAGTAPVNSLVASPDGAHVYVNPEVYEGAGPASELTADGKLVPRHAGPAVAASDRFVAVRERNPFVLKVYRHGEATPVWSEPSSDRSSGTSVSFAGDRVIFFRMADNKVWMHDLASGKERALAQLSSRLVISPDATGSIPATLWSPVVIDGTTAFVHGERIEAYRVE